jgi:hypothetical protein
MAPDRDEIDPRGLIFESYRIEGIGDPECRSIFLDWAIGVPMGQDSSEWVRRLLAEYGGKNPDHPMTSVLKAALDAPPANVRRGGAKARRAK